jgi:hypothetical protein
MNNNRKQAEELTSLIREAHRSKGLEAINGVVVEKRVSKEESKTLGNLRKKFDETERAGVALGQLASYGPY